MFFGAASNKRSTGKDRILLFTKSSTERKKWSVSYLGIVLTKKHLWRGPVNYAASTTRSNAGCWWCWCWCWCWLASHGIIRIKSNTIRFSTFYKQGRCCPQPFCARILYNLHGGRGKICMILLLHVKQNKTKLSKNSHPHNTIIGSGYFSFERLDYLSDETSKIHVRTYDNVCLLYTSPSPRD